MLKYIAITAMAVIGSFTIAKAQAGFMHSTVEERVKMVHEKLDSPFALDADKMSHAEAIFTDYYKGQEKVREKLMSGSKWPDGEAIMQAMQPITDEKDTKLKALLTVEQFRIWKDEIEPSMRPLRE